MAVHQFQLDVPEPTPPMMKDRMALMVNFDSGAMLECQVLWR
jgi:hypothetical protein